MIKNASWSLLAPPVGRKLFDEFGPRSTQSCVVARFAMRRSGKHGSKDLIGNWIDGSCADAAWKTGYDVLSTLQLSRCGPSETKGAVELPVAGILPRVTFHAQ